MAALTRQLFKGIGSAPLAAATQGTIAVAATDGDLTVTRVTTPTVPGVELKVDKSATVDSLHGWAGASHTGVPLATSTNDSGTYTARMYDYKGKATEGAKFSTQYADALTNKVLNETTTEGDATKVAISAPTNTSGFTKFEGSANIVGDIVATVAGTFDGVSGTYSCKSTTGNTCAVQLAGTGFILGQVDSNDSFSAAGGEWKFKPNNVDDKLKSVPDNAYAVYGWWMHVDGDGNATVSAFASHRGNPDTVNIDGLNGSATYKGGAAGKYAINSGMNDAGDFTANAELVATFNGSDAHTIKGTITDFTGGDGKPRNWSVELKEAALSDEGVISRAGDGDTIWTMDGAAADASGEWSGNLYEVKSETPTVGVGTFHTVYNDAYGDTGRMVGAFGVNKQ